MKKDNKKLEIVIVIVLAVLCLTGILFAVKSSRNTDNEVLPQEGTELVSRESTTENEVESTETTENTTTENETETIEETTEAVESTESTESTEDTTEAVESTGDATEVAEATDIENGEPLSEKDLAFSFLGYNTYKEYIEAGNNGSAYIVADNAAMIMSGEFTDDGDVLESTVRGIKLGDSIDKVFELYGTADKYDKCTKKFFAHDDLKDTDQYTYFLKLDSTKDYFYAFTFYTDQYSDVIGLIIEPISMEYWSAD